ncbi:MFS transporter [Gordonia namibiensis]|uniref:MFS transporter n=1 Tax=Gordonia namibiensis TaxID=168480 RepID=UPI000590CF82|nr:MFS transporter [Gordonia namibiensis]
MSESPTRAAARPHPHPWRVFAATSVGVIAVFVAMSGLTVALPTLSRELGATPAQSTWILLGYMVVTTALILVFGRLADIVGRRPLYLSGLIVFTLASTLCIVSPSAEFLIVARVLQGIGAAAVVTNNTALLTDTFPPHLLSRALGWNATVAAIGQIIGPVVGGAATALFGWRGLFAAVLGIALIATAASLLVIPRRVGGIRSREPFDLAGAILATTLLTAVVLALTPSSSAAWLPWCFGAMSLVVGVLLIVVQRRRAHPLIDLSLFADRGISLVLLAGLLTATATYAVALIISLYVQAVDGTSPFVAGLLVTPVAAGTVIAASAAGWLVIRIAPRTLAATGMALNTVGVLGVAVVLSADGSLPVTALFLFLIGTGIGLFMTPSTSVLMLTVPAQRRGIANGMRSTLQNVGNLLSTAIVVAIIPIGLGAAAQQAAYGGSPAAFDDADLSRFVDNLQLAGVVLGAMSAAGIAVCLSFPRRMPTPEAEVRPVPEYATTKESA